MATTKRRLQRDLVFHRQAFMVALAALACFSDRKNLNCVTERPIRLSGPDVEDGTQFDLHPIRRLLESDGRDKILKNFFTTALRTVVRDSYEAIWQYCKATKETGNMELLRDQPWFQFLRVIRDAFSHDAKWTFYSQTKKILPIEWGGIKVAPDLEGKKLRFDHIPLTAFFDLLAAAEQFVVEHLQ